MTKPTKLHNVGIGINPKYFERGAREFTRATERIRERSTLKPHPYTLRTPPTTTRGAYTAILRGVVTDIRDLATFILSLRIKRETDE